jgi:hypothetical protein
MEKARRSDPGPDSYAGLFGNPEDVLRGPHERARVSKWQSDRHLHRAPRRVPWIFPKPTAFSIHLDLPSAPLSIGYILKRQTIASDLGKISVTEDRPGGTAHPNPSPGVGHEPSPRGASDSPPISPIPQIGPSFCLPHSSGRNLPSPGAGPRGRLRHAQGRGGSRTRHRHSSA